MTLHVASGSSRTLWRPASAGLLGVAAGVVITLGAQSTPAPALLHSVAYDWSTLTVRQTKVGESRRVLHGPTPTLEELDVHITTLNPGQEPHGIHQHPKEEVLIVKEGTVEAFVHGRWQKLDAGSVIFQATNEPHTIRNVGKTPATYHVVEILSAKAAAKTQ